jgi:hypothetical protein
VLQTLSWLSGTRPGAWLASQVCSAAKGLSPGPASEPDSRSGVEHPPGCALWKQLDVAESDLLPGFKMGNPDLVGGALFKDNTKTLTF